MNAQQLAAHRAAVIIDQPRVCAECGQRRPVREIMGNAYAVLGYCGHVQLLAEAEQAELGGNLPVYYRPAS